LARWVLRDKFRAIQLPAQKNPSTLNPSYMKKSIFFLLLATCCSFSAAYAQSLIAVQQQGDASFLPRCEGLTMLP
jgi:hypothetical protein